MKTWFSKIFGKEQKPPPAGGDTAVAPKVDAEQTILIDFQYRGYGWLRPEGVRRQLEKMTAEWQRPPRMPCEQTAK
jgi:hypothetical protein